MKKITSTLLIGILGGALPLGAYVFFNKTKLESQSYKNKMIANQNNSILRFANNNTSNNSANHQSSSINLPNFVEASESSVNSVVHITTKVMREQTSMDPFYEFFYGQGMGGQKRKQFGQGSGSGVILTEDGYIITNNHVVEDASEIEVTLNDKTKYNAELVGTDPSTDIAVLKIKEKNLPFMQIGNSDNVKIGEWVLAVGNPFNLTSTVTAGIVSAKGRSINIIGDKLRGNSNLAPIESFIQTDAAVNPGNSGGALVNTKGELIGINTAIASQTGSYSGYSFAVPINLAKKVMTDLISYGTVQRGYIGVSIADITQELKEKKGLDAIKGVYVANVLESGAASEAGIKKGDVITHVGSVEVNSVAKLQEEIGKKKPGDVVLVTVKSGSKENVKSITLKNREGSTKLVKKEELHKTRALGALFKKLSNKEKLDLGISNGVKVESITMGKLRMSGLKSGDIITKFNNEKINSPEQLTRKIQSHKGGVLLEIVSEKGKKEYIGFGL